MKLVILSLLVLGTSGFAADAKSFKIDQDCSGEIFCAEVTGPFSRAEAKIDGVVYKAKQADATCCQLASQIQKKVCDEKADPVGATVLCK